MKKNLLIICLLFFCGIQVFAQQKWYVSFNTGYALKMSSQNLYNEDLDLYFINYNEHYDDEDNSYYGNYKQINNLSSVFN